MSLKVTLELDLKYDQENPRYQWYLEHSKLEDTPKNYLEWGLRCEFWTQNVDFKIESVQTLGEN